MTRIFSAIAIMVVSVFLSGVSAFAAEVTHKIAVHVDQNDKRIMNMALNNVQNLTKYYESKGEKVIVEVVAYGPGLHMYRDDTSPVKSRIAAMALSMPNLKFSACGNTRRKMTKKAGKEIKLISEATMVPSGVVQLVKLQENGYAYIRP